MNNSVLKNQTKATDYEKNLRKVLGWESLENKILKKSAGILEGALKKSGVAYQKEMRKEWENRVKRLDKQSKR